MSLDTYYPATPWDGQDTHEAQTYYYLDLSDQYLAHGTYARLSKIEQTRAEQGRSQVTTDMIAPIPDWEPKAESIMWEDPAYFDTFERKVAVRTFTGKIAMRETDDLYVAFKKGGARGLVPIMRSEFGNLMITQMNMRARNIWLQAPNRSYGAGEVSAFANITTDHLLSAEFIDGVHGLMAETGRPYQAQEYSLANVQNVCYTSPGALKDLRDSLRTYTESPLIDVAQYSAMGIIPYKGDSFIWNNTRFVSEPNSILWNAGEIFYQHTVTSPIEAGSGAPNPSSDPVLGVYYLGQKERVVNRYLQLDSVTGFAVNDIVTIHSARASGSDGFGVTDGVDWRDSKTTQRRIVAINVGANQITLDKPMMKAYSTDVVSGGGVGYAWVTKGRHIHSVLTLNSNEGVKLVVREPNQVMQPVPIDDYNSMYRVTWKGHWDFNLWQPETFHVGFFAGTNFKLGGLGYIS